MEELELVCTGRRVLRRWSGLLLSGSPLPRPLCSAPCSPGALPAFFLGLPCSETATVPVAKKLHTTQACYKEFHVPHWSS